MGGFVHIIESPSADDLLDGRTEGRVLGEALRLAEIPHSYNLPTTVQAFRKALHDRLLDAWKHHQQPPIVHLSMHGNNDGVALTDGTFLSWTDLRHSLAPLTNAMQGGLLICMSSCFGSSGCRMAMHDESDQPFWALVGNAGSASWSDAAVAYVTFYHLFFKGIPVKECVDRMKMASNDTNFMLWSGREVKASWVEHVQKFRREQIAAALRGTAQT